MYSMKDARRMQRLYPEMGVDLRRRSGQFRTGWYSGTMAVEEDAQRRAENKDEKAKS